MMDWQPISTAPKDGTEVDLWLVSQSGEGWRVPDAYWTELNGKEGWEGLKISDCYNLVPSWFHQWLEFDYTEPLCHRRFAKATHWMLPPSEPT